MSLFEFAKKSDKNTKGGPVTPLLESMLKQLGYSYRLLPENLSPDKVMDIYRKALERGKKEGFTPVLMPEDDILDEYFGILHDKEEYSVKKTLQKIGNNGKELLQDGLKALIDPEEEDLEALDLNELLGEMENGVPNDSFSSMVDFMDGRMKPTVLIEVPTRNPWEVVVYVPFGGWNDCPEPEKMAAICKYWYEKYQAVPAVITHDTLEFLLPCPVAKEEAMEVAKEHFIFCTDCVDQCTENGTIGEVADMLWQSHVWYFWWD